MDTDKSECLHCGRTVSDHVYRLSDGLRCRTGDTVYEELRDANGEIDCWRHHLPRCPHCGYEHQDYCDFFGDGFEQDDDVTTHECDRCGKPFALRLHVDYSYSSKPA